PQSRLYLTLSIVEILHLCTSPYVCCSQSHSATSDLSPFPTRRSSDLPLDPEGRDPPGLRDGRSPAPLGGARLRLARAGRHPRSPDRKSTRLNSSHEWISYAVFCLKKKKKRKSNRCMWTEG